MRLVMGISDRIYRDQLRHQDRRGHAAEIQRNPAVIKAYLGEEVEAMTHAQHGWPARGLRQDRGRCTT